MVAMTDILPCSSSECLIRDCNRIWTFERPTDGPTQQSHRNPELFFHMVEAAIAKGFTEEATKERYWLDEVVETYLVYGGLLNSKEACQGPQMYDREKHKDISSKQDQSTKTQPSQLPI